ncbi:MAG: L-threonylcarbamoyladenylate synthase [bacterium]|nr:L-threonylcarbamoyladenylate synthase [bacterium]
MKTIKIDLKNNYDIAIEKAAKVLEKGGTIVFPTETVYGLGANALNESAVEQVFNIKRRPPSKPVPIVARNLTWVKELAYIHPKLEKPLGQIWPSATTVILPKRDIIPWITTAKQNSIGIRVPEYAFINKLLAKFGYPLTATSANISGMPATGNIDDIKKMFGPDSVWRPDLIIDAGNLPPNQPSTILDLTTIRPRITRVGAVKPEELMRILGVQ